MEGRAWRGAGLRGWGLGTAKSAFKTSFVLLRTQGLEELKGHPLPSRHLTAKFSVTDH